MSAPRSTPRDSVVNVDGSSSSSAAAQTSDAVAPPTYAPPTYASFSPANLSSAAAAAASSAAKRRSTILVHQKSPLLLATPPQVTRALAYSHPFLLPLNKLAGLVSWTTDDHWESFLLLVAFWAVVQYGDAALRFAAPIVTVMLLIAGMYGRRFSPLSSSGWAEYFPSGAADGGKKGAGGGDGGGGGGGGGAGNHQRAPSETTSTRHQKTLDEIVDTLKVFTTRCNILMEPLLEMTDFLSTQRTATSATTRPALTTLFVRILAITPLWIALTLPPLRIITTKRVILVVGTLFLTWHSKACCISRTLLWRSATVRKLARASTGLPFEIPAKTKGAATEATAAKGHPTTETNNNNNNNKDEVKKPISALTAALKGGGNRRLLRGGGAGGGASAVRFTFILYENQRRWVGLGWTNSLFAYDRAAWTDEQNNPMPSRDDFELPEVEDALARWRWVEGSRWRVDGAPDLLAGGEAGDRKGQGQGQGEDYAVYDTEAARNGWVYYDNKWQNGRRGQDGWNRWTRRRKWYRDAELVEAPIDEEKEEEEEQSPDQDKTPVASPADPPPALPPRTSVDARRSDVSLLSAQLLSASSPESSTTRLSSSSSSNSPEMTTTTTTTAATSKSASKDGGGGGGTIAEHEEADEAPLSTSSKSTTSRFKWPTPTLRRRATGGSTNQQQQQQRSRRTSEASSAAASSSSSSRPAPTDDDVGFFGSLTPALELEIQGHRKGQDTWGIGDEAQMGLE